MNHYSPAISISAKRCSPAGAVLILSLCLVLGATTQLAAQVLDEVTVDLRSGAIQHMLPFDCPFILKGAVGDRAQTVQVWYRKVASKEEANSATLADVGWSDSAMWRRVPEIDAGPAIFSVTLGPLEPQEYYVFKFSVSYSLDAAQQQVIRASVGETINDMVVNLKRGSLAIDYIKSLRLTLSHKFTSRNGMDYVIEPNTLFDTISKSEKPLSRFTDLLRNIDQPSENIRVFANSCENQTIALKALLDTIIGNSGVQNILQAIKGSPHTMIMPIATGHATEIQLLLADKNGTTCIAYGQPLTTVAPRPLYRTGTIAEIQSASTQYATYRNGFSTAETFLNSLLNDSKRVLDTLLKIGAITQSDIDALRLFMSGRNLADASTYCFLLHGNMAKLVDQLPALESAISQMADSAKVLITRIRAVSASTVVAHTSYKTYYLSGDAGFMWVPTFDRVLPYTVTSIYFRPINANAPLSEYGSLLHRLTLNIGFTLESVANSAKGRSDFFANKAIVVGAGIRVTEVVRIGFGAVLFSAHDPNPLVDNPHIDGSFYTSFALDLGILGETAWKAVFGR